MTQKNCAPISAGTDFEFSVDLSIISEYNSAIYLGDLQSPGISNYLVLQFDNHGQHAGGLQIINDGQRIFWESTSHSGNSAFLNVKRENSTYFFYIDGNLEWQMTIPEFEGLDLHYGVRNKITSGPYGVTATTAIDNWNYVPEPTSLLLLSFGSLMLRKCRP